MTSLRKAASVIPFSKSCASASERACTLAARRSQDWQYGAQRNVEPSPYRLRTVTVLSPCFAVLPLYGGVRGGFASAKIIQKPRNSKSLSPLYHQANYHFNTTNSYPNYQIVTPTSLPNYHFATPSNTPTIFLTKCTFLHFGFFTTA